MVQFKEKHKINEARYHDLARIQLIKVTSLPHQEIDIMVSKHRNDSPLNDRPKQGHVRLIRDLQQLEEEGRTLAKFERARKALDHLDRLIARLEQLGKDEQDFKG